MLVVSIEKCKGCLKIGDANVVYLETKGSKVRLGIEAPREMRVTRHRTADVPELRGKIRGRASERV